ncbi:hypothetical protein FB451DRAFT_1049697, partial [Mycena latifolia]
GERLLLWHGSRSTNFAGMSRSSRLFLSRSSSGYIFGRGVYFADVRNICSLSDGTGLMLLCEVAAAPFFER